MKEQINVTAPFVDTRRLRLLVAIASFGEKNIEFLKRIIRRYRSLPMEVEVVVVSEAPKNLDAGVRLLVGLPSENPWSLPFAHKKLFVDNVDRYDLFIYSEDDMEVTEENLQAFLRVTPSLARDEIAGFLRFETNQAGDRLLPEVHGASHWKPETVRRRGPHTVAEFSNEHAAFYLLTRDQLRSAIASGGFMREPYEGRYDMLCTAATDPYTTCGFRKVVCISSLEDFLIHHLPNRYAGHLGLPLASVKAQVQTLMSIGNDAHPATTLFEMDPGILQQQWSKSFYEGPCDDFLRMIPEGTQTALSIGCGWGATEARLIERGITVTALPMDSVIGAVAARRGIEVIYASLEEGMRKLRGRQFDAVLLSNLLQVLPDPSAVLDQCSRLMRPGGVVVIASMNFDCLPMLAGRILGRGEYRKLRAALSRGIQPLSIVRVNRWLQRAGFGLDGLVWQGSRGNGSVSGATPKSGVLARCFSQGWRSLRQAGLDLDALIWRDTSGQPDHSLGVRHRPGRLVATSWVARAVRRG